MRAEGERRTATESVLEVTYRWVPLPWAKLQPSVQCVLGPHFSGHDALVLGLRGTVGL